MSIEITASQIDASAASAGLMVGVCAEDSYSHPAMLRIVRGAHGSAVYRRAPSRACADMGPMSAMRCTKDAWSRLEPEAERRYLLAAHKLRVMVDSADGWARAQRQLPADWMCAND
jgi:hypothetical protein